MVEQHFPPQSVKERPGNGREVEASRSLVAALEEMASIDAAEWKQFIASVRRFMAQKRSDLDRRERLLLGDGK